MRASRLLTILILLQVRGRMSADALARELEVSVRTVYRDVDELGAAGVPVYAERGRAGGFALLGGYRTQLTGLTLGEADAVSLIGLAQAAADLGFGEHAESARRKILASLPSESGKAAQRVAARFHVDPAPWYARQPPPPALRALAEAVWADRSVRVTYESWKGIVRRSFTPLGLIMKAGSWYVAGAVADATRIFRVDGIRDLEIGTEPARRPARFDLAKFWADSAQEFETRLRSETARVRLSPRGLKLLRDWNPAAADAVTKQQPAPDRDGYVEARIPFEPPPQGVREALRIGADLEVLEPRELRAAIAAEAQKITTIHRKKRRR